MAEWSGLSQKLGSSLMYSYLWSLSLPVTSAECQWGTVTMMGADSSTASFSSTAAATSGFLFFGSSERATDGLQVKSWKHMFGNRQRRLISLCSRWLHFHLYQRKRKKSVIGIIIVIRSLRVKGRFWNFTWMIQMVWVYSTHKNQYRLAASIEISKLRNMCFSFSLYTFTGLMDVGPWGTSVRRWSMNLPIRKLSPPAVCFCLKWFKIGLEELLWG